MSGDALQAQNKLWWERNPMRYDWHGPMPFPEGSPEFFNEIDRRFFMALPLFYRNSFFRDILPLKALWGKRVLEIGCGLGMHAQRLAEAGCLLSAIDLTPRAVEMTRKRFLLRGLTADIQVMDAERMSFGDGSFDFVWSWGVLHHTADPAKALKEARRVLKPGGELRMMVYHRDSLVARLNILRGILSGKLKPNVSTDDLLNLYSDGYVARFYRRNDLAELLRSCGFQVEKILSFGQKAEVIPLPGKGALGRLKSFLLAALPDRPAAAVLSLFGSFLFAIAENPSSKTCDDRSVR